MRRTKRRSDPDSSSGAGGAIACRSSLFYAAAIGGVRRRVGELPRHEEVGEFVGVAGKIVELACGAVRGDSRAEGPRRVGVAEDELVRP